MSVPDAIALHRAASMCAKPGATFLEFAAGWGFSTLCILDAIGQEKVRFITSEVAGDCWLALRELLGNTKAERWEGDLRDREEVLRGLSLDFLFIDSEHNEPIISWYIDTLFPLVKPSGMIAVHDVLDPSSDHYVYERRKVEESMEVYGLEVVRLLGEEEEQELCGMLPWPHSHCGVRRACNTLVMRRSVSGQARKNKG